MRKSDPCGIVLLNPVFAELPFVEAPLSYLKPMAEKPIYYINEPPAGILRDTTSPVDAPSRESIELRSLVLYST